MYFCLQILKWWSCLRHMGFSSSSLWKRLRLSRSSSRWAFLIITLSIYEKKKTKFRMCLQWKCFSRRWLRWNQMRRPHCHCICSTETTHSFESLTLSTTATLLTSKVRMRNRSFGVKVGRFWCHLPLVLFRAFLPISGYSGVRPAGLLRLRLLISRNRERPRRAILRRGRDRDSARWLCFLLS